MFSAYVGCGCYILAELFSWNTGIIIFPVFLPLSVLIFFSGAGSRVCGQIWVLLRVQSFRHQYTVHMQHNCFWGRCANSNCIN